MTNITQKPNAGFFRRLIAWICDTLLVTFLLIIGSGIIVLILDGLMIIGLFQNSSMYSNATDVLSHHPLIGPLFTFYTAAIWIGYFVYFWKKGQSPGMRLCHLMITNEQGNTITVTQALIRLFTSAFGLSNLAVLLDPKKRGFHDIWAKTRVFVTDKS